MYIDSIVRVYIVDGKSLLQLYYGLTGDTMHLNVKMRSLD
jgi:hypothetical protein